MKPVNFLPPTHESETDIVTSESQLRGSIPDYSYLPPRSRHPWRKVFFIFVGFACFCVFGMLAIGGVLVVNGAIQVKQAVNRGQAAVVAVDFSEATTALQEAVTGLRNMQKGFPFLRFLEPIPWVGDKLAGTQAAIEASEETLEVILSGAEIADEVLSTVSGASQTVIQADGSTEARPYSDLSDEDKQRLLNGLAHSLPQLIDMQVRLRLAQSDLERLDEYELLPSLEAAIQPLRDLIPDMITSVDVLIPFAAIAPEFGGLGQDRQFLVLFLNNTELRPGGGFIGVYGLMVTRDGEIKSLITDDSYAIDAYVQGNPAYHVNPPPPLVSWLGQPTWFFRDADWSPDFEQTARDSVQLMRQEIAFGGQPVPEIHGVVGITPSFISRLLSFVGPITVEGQTFNSANVADLLEYQVEQGFVDSGVPLEQRKEIVSVLTEEMVDRLLELPPSSWTDLFRILHEGFDEKEIALMSYEPDIQAALEDNGWGGVLNSATADDVLLTVDANLAALKTDPVVERQVNYKVNKVGNGYRATASITYTHNGTFNWKTTRYRTYTRIYVPAGSTLVSSSGSLKDDKTRNPNLEPGTVDVVQEYGMTSFGAFIAIEPGQTGTLSFTYDLPVTVANAIARGSYRMLALKQMGAGDNLLTLDLDFGNTLASAEPPELPADYGDNLYHLTTRLNTDKLFTVQF